VNQPPHGTSLDPGVFPSGEGGLSFARRKQVSVSSQMRPHWKVGFQGDGTSYFLLLLQQNLTWEEKKELKGLASPKKEKKKKIRFPKPGKNTCFFQEGLP